MVKKFSFLEKARIRINRETQKMKKKSYTGSEQAATRNEQKKKRSSKKSDKHQIKGREKENKREGRTYLRWVCVC